MTPRQRDFLKFIRKYWADNECSPTYEEIRVALGAKSKASVATVVYRLEGRGYITRIPNLARSIRLVDTPATPGVPQPETVPVSPIPEVGDDPNAVGLIDDPNADVPWA